MAQPIFIWQVNHADDDATPTMVTFDTTNDRLQFGYNVSASDAAALGNVTRPETGNKWADQLWHYDASAAGIEYQKILAHRNPDVASGFKQKVISIANDVAFASVPYITAYNTGDRSLGNVWDGTTYHAYPLIKIIDNTSFSGSNNQYWGEVSDAVMMTKDTAGSANPNGVKADTNYVSFDDATAKTRYFDIALVVPEDFTAGENNCRVSVRYTWS